MVNTHIKNFLVILVVCCFGSLVCSQTARESSSTSAAFNCPNTGNASVSFRNNRNDLLFEFNQQSSTTRYYNTSIGDNLDKVYGHFMCRADLSNELCNSCILNGTRFSLLYALSSCQYVDGTFVTEICTFQYSNRSAYGLGKPDFFKIYHSPVNVSSYEHFNQTVQSTVEDVINEAAFGSRNNSTFGFATQEANFTANETLYSLAQCAPDIMGSNCSLCLHSILSQLKTTADGADGAIVAYGAAAKCYLRYDLVSFYNLGVVD